jgi:hypothetical protein
VNDEFGKMWREVVVVYCKVSLCLSEGTENCAKF